MVNKAIPATIVHGDPRFLNNLWFSEDPSIIRDNQNLCYAELQRKMMNAGVDLNTEDLNPYEASKLVLFVDVPRRGQYFKMPGQIWYALLNEAPCAYEKNWRISFHSQYDKIFTWDEALIDNEKYFLIRLGYNLEYNDFSQRFSDRKFLTMIVGAKHSSYPGALYKDRYQIIKWFAKNKPAAFDLYGVGWPDRLRPIFGPRMEARIPAFVKRIVESFYPPNLVYKGRVEGKRSVLSRYKFSICYENMGDKAGFVTEKIFDSFCSGCVPVYRGATNIHALIPSGCFIDARQFSTIQQMYSFLAKIKAEEFDRYQDNIKKFLISEQGKQFSATVFAEVLLNSMVADLSKGG